MLIIEYIAWRIVTVEPAFSLAASDIANCSNTSPIPDNFMTMMKETGIKYSPPKSG